MLKIRRPSHEWVRHRFVSEGVEILEAGFDRHVYERHMHDTYAIGFTVRGVQRFWCRGTTHDSTPGAVIVICPGDAHDGQSGAPGGYEYRMFYLAAELVQRMLEEVGERRDKNLAPASPLVANRILAQKLNEAWRALNHSADSLAADALLHDMVLSVTALHGPRPADRGFTLDRSALQRVRDVLHARVEQPLTVQELADIASLSRFQLTRQFQKAFGLPLHAYHLHVRLEEAKHRLRRGAAIASVAADLGFADQSHFHRRFKGAFGLTPGEWCRSVATPGPLPKDSNLHRDTRPSPR
jgi:AraC-like DNA-binding protein